MRVAIIGGTGFVGSYIVDELCDAGHEVSLLVRPGSEGVMLMGDLEHEYRRVTINTFGGGVVEVLRGLVATFGLGMPQHR